MKGAIFVKKNFGILPSGQEASLYTISCGGITAGISDYGATLVSLLVPDGAGVPADVVLGFDDCIGYANGGGIQGAAFQLNGRDYAMTPNENGNNLHSGPDFYFQRMWKLISHTDTAVVLELHSPHGDQGFPGNAVIRVTYSLDASGGLHIVYDGTCDQDTVFNLTNHSYFNLRGHQHTDAAMDQLLPLPGRFFNPDDAESIPTGEMRSVDGTPMDFRTPKAIGRDINEDYEPLNLQGGYDHNYEVFCNPCAVVSDPVSGRIMAVYTDLPGIQFYAGNFLTGKGKGGVEYGKRSGIALETQYYPDSIHHPEWDQPVTKAGEKYHTETVYRFSN